MVMDFAGIDNLRAWFQKGDSPLVLGGLSPFWNQALNPFQVEEELSRGGRLVFYEYCISVVFLTLRRPSRVRLLRAGESGFRKGLPYTLLTLLLGWWGVPWRLLYTPIVLLTNLAGGHDVTADVRPILLAESP